MTMFLDRFDYTFDMCEKSLSAIIRSLGWTKTGQTPKQHQFEQKKFSQITCNNVKSHVYDRYAALLAVLRVIRCAQ